MGLIGGAALDAHLCAGGTVVTASDRAARAILADFHQARRGEDLEAWATPRVLSWQSFVRQVWEERSREPRLVLNTHQERSLWERVIRSSGETAAHLGSRNLASLSMQAHGLLCSHAPQFLEAKNRTSWDQDAAAFSRWLSGFDALCREHDAISLARLPIETIPLLDSGEERPMLLLAGFDRILPVQEAFLKAWGGWDRVTPSGQAARVQFFSAANSAEELAACVKWCRNRLESSPGSTILVITQEVQKRRGEFERSFLGDGTTSAPFEFSLGVSLGRTDAVRSALLYLRWLDSELAEQEMDWLFAAPCAVADSSEGAGLQRAMTAARRRHLQRPHWTLDAFLLGETRATVPDAWKRRVVAARDHLRHLASRSRSPLEWAEAVAHLLNLTGWPGAMAGTSAEFQVLQRWQDALDLCASLGFDRRRFSWREFLSELDAIAEETLYASESEGAPILIAGPSESAGLSADAIWFLGAEEGGWPARGQLHPLLPIDLQRRFAMPHSTAKLDHEHSVAITRRLLASAGEANFSYPRQREGGDTRPSRLVADVAGAAMPLTKELLPASYPAPLTRAVEDMPAVSFTAAAARPGEPLRLRGGAAVLSAQSQCAFKAFAMARLGADRWEFAEPALTAAERGMLLHEVLHAIWAGPPSGIRTLEELQAVADLEQFVREHVSRTAASYAPLRIRDLMPARYLELEQERLVRVLSEWLALERQRAAFEVAATELDASRTVAGVSLDLRLDRLDRLADGTMLVIDYKTGDVSPKSWELPRPDDVQLPLYAIFGLKDEERTGGLVFAKVRPGEMCFDGRVRDAARLTSLPAGSSLVKFPLTEEQLAAWRMTIERLARDYLSGRADVDPRDPPDTCTRCGLHAVCRVRQSEAWGGEVLEGPDE